jgi:hypothetical protein
MLTAGYRESRTERTSHSSLYGIFTHSTCYDFRVLVPVHDVFVLYCTVQVHKVDSTPRNIAHLSTSSIQVVLIPGYKNAKCIL